MENNIFSVIENGNQPLKEQIIAEIDGYTIEVCTSKESKLIAYKLRYDAFIKSYPLLTNNEGLLYDELDESDNTWSFLVWYQGKPIATVRGSIWGFQYGWANTVVTKYFAKELNLNIGKQNILESSRYAVSPEFQGRKSLFAQMLCFHIHAINSAIHNCNYIITVVKQSHAPFYDRFLGLNVISNTPKYIEWFNVEGLLLGAERDKSMSVALKRGMPDYTGVELNKFIKILNL